MMSERKTDGLLHDRVHIEVVSDKEGPIARLRRERDDLAEALRELYTCYAVEGTATQLGRACRRAKALIARIDAEKSK